jgi:predicted amidohydrolase
MSKLSVACIQNTPGPSLDENIEAALGLCREAARQGARLLSLPEYFSDLDVDGEGRLVFKAFAEEEHPALPAFQNLARELEVAVNLGSLPIATGDGKAFNRGYLIAPDGGIKTRYDKIHMFDIHLPDGESYLESATVEPGARPCLTDIFGVELGLTICYDLRFPELYRSLAQAGAQVLLAPAAFTRTTGKAHWHLLARARAVETGSFLVAACQCGDHPSGSGAYGHSLIVNPWGEILADGGEAPGVITAELNLEEVEEARARIPAWRTSRSYAVESRA